MPVKLNGFGLLNKLTMRSILSCFCTLAIAPIGVFAQETKLPSPTGAKLVSPLIKNPSPNQIKLERDSKGNPVITIDHPVDKSGVSINAPKPNSSSGKLPTTREAPGPSENIDDGSDGSGLDEKLENRETSEQFDLLKG